MYLTLFDQRQSLAHRCMTSDKKLQPEERKNIMMEYSLSVTE